MDKQYFELQYLESWDSIPFWASKNLKPRYCVKDESKDIMIYYDSSLVEIHRYSISGGNSSSNTNNEYYKKIPNFLSKYTYDIEDIFDFST